MKRVFAFAALALLTMFGTTAQAGGKFQGCHLGVGVGYSASKTDLSLNVPAGTAFDLDGLGLAGATFDGFGGCDAQMGNIVVGAWGDWTEHDSTFSITAPLSTASDVLSIDLKNQWSLGGRLGVVLHDNTLLYGLAGYTRASFSDITSAGKSLTAVPDASGYIVGGGIETALPWQGFFLDLRYSFSHLDRVDIPAGKYLSVGLETEVHTARVGLLYRLNFDGAAPAPLK